MKKFNYKLVLKYFILFICTLIFAFAQINGLSPFVFAFFFALLFVGFDEKLVSIFVLCSSIAIDPSLQTLLISITYIAVGLLSFYIHKFTKTNQKIITVFFVYLFSNITYIYYNHSDILSVVLYLILGLVCLYVFISVMQVLLLRKNCFKLTLDESICFLFSIAILGVGLSNISFGKFDVYRLVIMLGILLFSAIGRSSLACVFAMSLSLGVAFESFSLLPVAEFCVLALVSGIFVYPNKFKTSFVVILTDLLIQNYFFYRDFTIFYAVLPVLIACLLFVCIPNKVIAKISDIIYSKKSDVSARNVINTTRKNLRKRMSELSNIFLDMKQIHMNMLKKELSKEELVAMLTKEVLNECCRDCLDKNRCTRSLGTDNKSSIVSMIEIAVKKGKITLLDLPSSLTSRCAKVNCLINTINRLSDEYRQYKNMQEDVNNVKILLADQMGAVSNLLLNIGEEIDNNVSFDIARENKIINRLLSQNIECNEILLYTEKNDDTTAVALIKGQNAYNPLVEQVITEVLKIPMQVSNVVPVDDSGFNSVTLKKLNKYDVVFGLASCNKSGNEECGDCHSIIRLSTDKFLLALCDGMGNGKSAHKMSAMTLGLIENFYKVGFDNDTVLESVNRLIATNNQENYSTLDVCLIDLNNEIADFIKVGSPFGMIKHDGNIEVIEGGALPIGALESVLPATHKTTIATKDMIILVTDGITDAFGTSEDCCEFVSKLVNINPQTIAESILNEALRLNNMNAKDDMTVLVARMYLKN